MPLAPFAVFVCDRVVGASTLPCAGWITFCMRMLSSTSPVAHIGRPRPSQVEVSAGNGWCGRELAVPGASGSAVSAHACQDVADSRSQRSLIDALQYLVGEHPFGARNSGGVSRFSQPSQQDSSLVASFRSLQSRPWNGYATSKGALIPCPGSSGGTAWRL